jgi:urease accessory protein
VAPFFFGRRFREKQCEDAWTEVDFVLVDPRNHIDCCAFGARSPHEHGVWPFYDGLAHLFVTPEELLPVIALGLLAGLRGPRFGRAVLLALPVAWLVGSTAGVLLAPQLTPTGAEIILTIVLGALLAADRPLPLGFVVGLAILVHGILNGSELAKTLLSAQMSNVGVVVALFVSVSLLAGQAASVRLRWVRTAFRVAGSWIAAIGLLMLGWAMHIPA